MRRLTASLMMIGGACLLATGLFFAATAERTVAQDRDTRDDRQTEREDRSAQQASEEDDPAPTATEEPADERDAREARSGADASQSRDERDTTPSRQTQEDVPEPADDSEPSQDSRDRADSEETQQDSREREEPAPSGRESRQTGDDTSESRESRETRADRTREADDEDTEPDGDAETEPVADDGYVGRSECSACHRELGTNHRESAHALTLQTVSDDPSPILADFGQGEDVRTVQLPGESEARPFTADDIRLVIGSGRVVQRYAVAGTEDGSYLVLPAEWNVAEQNWQNFTLADDWTADAYDFVGNCASCHVTNFDVETATWAEDGVQCEACHGPGEIHLDVADAVGGSVDAEEYVELQMSVNLALDAQVCGQCHIRGTEPTADHPYPVDYLPGDNLLDESVFVPASVDDPVHWWATGHARQPNMQFNEWLNSTHATALTSAQESDDYETSCLTCHSVAYRRTEQALATGAVDEDYIDFADPVAAVEMHPFGVTCAACHNPHSEAEHAFNLVDESYALCTACHSNSSIPDGIHHPVQEMFEGLPIVDEIAELPGAHFSAEDGPDCQTCHMSAVPVADHEQRISHLSQTILPAAAIDIDGLEDSCTRCHDDLDAAELQTLIDDIQASTETRLSRAQAALDDTSADWVVNAVAFVDGDGSRGIHNYGYADIVLDTVEVELGLVPLPEPADIQTVADTDNGFDATTLPLMNIFVAGYPVLTIVLAVFGGANILLALFFLLRRRGIGFGVFSLLLGGVLIVGAISLPREIEIFSFIPTGDNGNCQICHATPGRQVTLLDGNRLDVSVDAAAIRQSVHGESSFIGPFGCLDCHGADYFPHESLLPTRLRDHRLSSVEFCVGCHADATEHYQQVRDRNILVGCTDCHGAHEVVPAEDLPATFSRNPVLSADLPEAHFDPISR